jgi:hypothetical protein
VNSNEAQSHPKNDGVWSVSTPPFPLDINTGIGFLINPAHSTGPSPVASDFSRHDHLYSSPNIPIPTRAVVTYEFDMPTTVDQLEIIQHQNGITQIEGLVGNTLGSLSSIGTIFGPSGNVVGAGALPEHGSQVFDFNNPTAGNFF